MAFPGALPYKPSNEIKGAVTACRGSAEIAFGAVPIETPPDNGFME